DAFHEHVIHGRTEAVNPANIGTKFAPHYILEVGAGESQVVRLRLSAKTATESKNAFGAFDEIFTKRIAEADEFYHAIAPNGCDKEALNVSRPGYAGLLWSKQFYNYVIREWLKGDPVQHKPPPER